MFQQDLFTGHVHGERGPAIPRPERHLDLPGILERLSTISERPRHAFMVLNLIAKAGGGTGSAGPYLEVDGRTVPIREWLCEALVPMAHRDPRRIARAAAIRAELDASGALSADPDAADRAVDQEVRARVRRTGLTHISRAVSDLVRAGLIKRHYQGYAVDHENRGAQRQAVYTLLPGTRLALAAAPASDVSNRAARRKAPVGNAGSCENTVGRD